MKKSRTRQRSHRTSTPSVICLPPPKPPATAPRQEPEVRQAMSLPQAEEPLVATQAAAETRQVRRKAQRAQARGFRHPAADPLKADARPASPPLDDDAPLPRHRSLARQPTGLVGRVGAWFARLIPRRSTAPMVSQQAMTDQMVALRSELAMVQGRLERMIAAATRK